MKHKAAQLSLNKQTKVKRRQVDESLQESNEYFRDLFDLNPLMLFTIDEDGKVLSANQCGLDQLGYSKNQLIGKQVINVFYEEDRTEALENLEQCFVEPEKIHQWELRKIRQDGTIIWVRETVRTMDDVGGKTTVLVACEDITKRKQVEEALRISEEKFSRAFRNSLVAISVATINDGRILDVSDNVEQLTGYRKDELIGQSIFKIGLWADPNSRTRMIKVLQDQGCVQSWEADLRIASGQIRNCELSAEIITVADEPCILSAIIDVTERKLAENAIAESEERFRSTFE
jgi:PAS domain S-box-containing protein